MFRIRNCGFTLIELLVVISIIGILTATAIPSYVGMQERGRRGAVSRVCNASVPDLHSWINAAKKGSSILGDITEIDTDGSSVVEIGNDDTNTELADNGVVTRFIEANQNMNSVSPWDSATDLWISGDQAVDQAACDTTAAGNPGQITLCFNPSENQTIRFMYISAADMNGAVFFSKTVSAD